MKKLVLIDGNSIANRAFYGLPDMTTTDGRHTNAVLGFLNILLKILDEENTDYLAVAFDVKHPTFRHEMFAEYKGTRKGMPEELKEQMPVIKEVLAAMGVLMLEKAGYEADDILGTVAKKGEKDGLAVSLVSGDRDLLQIADDVIKVRIPKTKRTGTEIEDYNTAEVIEKYGLKPAQIIDLKGLMGDAADNIPGVPGIGEKTATKILEQYETLENAIEHVDEITPAKAKNSLAENKELALLSKKLATIKTDCELDFEYESAVLGNIYTKEAYEILKNLEMKSMAMRFAKNMEQKPENAAGEAEMLPEVQRVTELTETEKLFAELSEKGHIGIAFAKTSEESVAVIADGKVLYEIVIDSFGFVNEDFIKEKLKELTKGTAVSAFAMKENGRFFCECSRDRLFDAEIAGYLLNPLKAVYGYDDIARDYLADNVPSREELTGKNAVKGLSEKEIDARIIKAAELEAVTAYKAYDILRLALENEGMTKLYEEVEMPLTFTLYDMERRGIKVNRAALADYGDNLAKSIDVLEKEIYKMAGCEFNINSPKQLGEVLFEKLKLPYGKKTKTGYSTSAEVLEKLKIEDPIVEKILTYRQYTKLKSTYADGLDTYIQEDERIHSKFNQTITATGRLSSTEPNLQNIPIRFELGRAIRKVFIPEEGYVFVDADYSQIELRVLAHMSGDDSLISAYREAQDIHRMTASKVFHIPFEEVTPAQRSNAKAVNFGIVYGISSFGLGQDLNISRKEAEEYIKQYFETYPGIKTYLDGLVKEAKDTGKVRTLYGRIRPVPEISSSNFMQRSFGERIAMNSPIQGTAADIMKIAMIRVNDILVKGNYKSRLLLQIHDELLIETYLPELEDVKEILAGEMQNAAELKVPLEVEVNTGSNWYEAK